MVRPASDGGEKTADMADLRRVRLSCVPRRAQVRRRSRARSTVPHHRVAGMHAVCRQTSRQAAEGIAWDQPPDVTGVWTASDQGFVPTAGTEVFVELMDGIASNGITTNFRALWAWFSMRLVDVGMYPPVP